MNKNVLLGVGAGCGCLSLLAALAVVAIVIVSVSASGQKPSPRGGEGGPRPQSVAGLEFDLRLMKIENDQPTQPTDVFRAGDTVGARVQWLRVERNVEVGRLWISIQSGGSKPIGEPKSFDVGPGQQGQTKFFTLTTEGARPGRYGFILFVNTGDRKPVVGSVQFTIQ
jgi:hypothetical protein